MIFCLTCPFSECAAGYEGAGTPDLTGCAACATGTFKAVAGDGTCTDCPAGQTTNAAGTACEDCPPDTYGTTAGAGCYPCDPTTETTHGVSGATTCSKYTNTLYTLHLFTRCKCGIFFLNFFRPRVQIS